MATYAIGDVQGCFDQLQTLLHTLHYKPDEDILWFVGDIVNRGPDSLKTLRFIHSLGDRAVTVLGNHDLHLLAIAYSNNRPNKKDTFADILAAADRDELMQWLRHRPLIHHDAKLNMCMVHAGIHPEWSIADALRYAHEVETLLQSKYIGEFLSHMYGDKPDTWSNDLVGWDRLRFITNVFTRMRYLHKDTAALSLKEKSALGTQADYLTPWFSANQRKTDNLPIVFGHWSTLTNPGLKNIYPIDTGCLWGGKLSALRLDASPLNVIAIDCPQSRAIDA